MSFKGKIIDALDMLRKNEQYNNQMYKARAYARVIEQIKDLPRVASMHDLSNVKGIGNRIREKITEIFETGSLAAANNVIHVVDELQQIHGVGPAKAHDLIVKYGVQSLDDLRSRQDELLNATQKIGLKYVEDTRVKIPRKEMMSHQAKVRKICNTVDKDIVFEMVGSFRRGAKASGDIDILIRGATTATFAMLCDKMRAYKYVADTLAQGPKKFMGIARLTKRSKARRIDMLLTSAQEYPYALLYFTGNDTFNVAMRKLALEKGYSLSEHGLKPAKNQKAPPPMKNEKDIFKFLEIPYLAPEARNEKNL